MINDNEIGITFAERLKVLRESKGLNQSQLADELKVSRGAVSYYERAERVPDIIFASRAAVFFGVPTDYLLGRTDDPRPNPSAVDELGLSPKTIKRILQAKTNSDMDDYIGIYDAFLSSSQFDSIVIKTRCLASASIAEEIYYRTMNRFRQKNPDESELEYFERNFVNREGLFQKLSEIANDMEVSDNGHISGYLRYMVKLEQANEDAINDLDAFVIDGIGPEVVCPALRTDINELFDSLIKDILAVVKRKFYAQQTEE